VCCVRGVGYCTALHCTWWGVRYVRVIIGSLGFKLSTLLRRNKVFCKCVPAVRLEAVNAKATVLHNVTACSLVEGYQHFRYLHTYFAVKMEEGYSSETLAAFCRIPEEIFESACSITAGDRVAYHQLDTAAYRVCLWSGCKINARS
jgi:hypothetical protein